MSGGCVHVQHLKWNGGGWHIGIYNVSKGIDVDIDTQLIKRLCRRLRCCTGSKPIKIFFHLNDLIFFQIYISNAMQCQSAGDVVSSECVSTFVQRCNADDETVSCVFRIRTLSDRRGLARGRCR